METTILFWLLSVSVTYLLLTSIILLKNRFEFTPLVDDTAENDKCKKISVCIPARNEDQKIGTLLDSLFNQSYQSFDVHVLDDHSTDKTPDILQSYLKARPDLLSVHPGRRKPDDWLGKPWACHQLGNAARGELLLFLDADTQLQPDTLSKINATFQFYHLDMLTVWPQQVLGSFWEKCVIPLIYYALLTVLPTVYVYRIPRWMPAVIYNRVDDAFAAANGQCIAFRKEAYGKINGHQSVKNRVVEDVELAKVSKRAGLQMRMFSGTGSVRCRMYRSEKELFDGLRKNFLAGFGNSLPAFISSAVLHMIVFILPFAALIYHLVQPDPAVLYLAVSSVVIIFSQRLVIDAWFRWDPLFLFTHPLGVLWFQRLGAVKIIDKLTGRKSIWKGREV